VGEVQPLEGSAAGVQASRISPSDRSTRPISCRLVMIREMELFRRPNFFWRPLGCTGSRARVIRIWARTSFSLRRIVLI
jgi:hypothetical protein